MDIHHGSVAVSAVEQGGTKNEGLCRQDRGGHRRRHRDGPRTGATAGRGRLQCRHVRPLRPNDGGDQAALRGHTAAAGPAHHHACRRRFRRQPGAAFSRRGCRAAGHRQDPPAVQQCRDWRRWQHVRQQPRGMGKDLQYLLGRRLPLHARLPADAAEGGPGPHRQHQQRQRLLGICRAAYFAHLRTARRNSR